MYEYDGVRRVSYPDDEIGAAVFVPVCQKCGRFVTANKSVRVNEINGLADEPNATCKRCGPVAMPFEGFF